MRKSVRVVKLRNVALAATAAAAVVACGGGGSVDQVGASASLQPLAAGRPQTGPLTLVVDGSGAFQLPAATATEYEKHLLVATANAGAAPFAEPAAPGSAASYDPAALRKQWCFTAESSGRPEELGDRRVVPPTQMFDDVWAFGLRTVLQYAFKGPDGKVFLIDTLNNPTEASTITMQGLQAMGSSGAELIGAMPTHGHGDHHGGGAYLQQNFGIPIYLGSGDQNNKPFTVTPIPSGDMGPQEWTFGFLATTLLSTPGHTPGTLSGVVPVTLAGKQYSMAFWGGTAMPNTIVAAKEYLDGSERLYRLAEVKKVDGTIHTHPFVDGSLTKIDALATTPHLKATANPFLIGNALAQRSLAVLRQCSAAKVAQVDATATMPAWHVTTTELTTAGNPQGAVVGKATVRTPYGVLKNGLVTFTASTGETCTAATNGEGTATCPIRVRGAGATSVTATFAQGELEDGTVQLGSSATAQLQ